MRQVPASILCVKAARANSDQLHPRKLLLFAVTDVLTDIAILIVPFFYLYRVRMTLKEKLGAAFVFLLGFM
jgi:uncharacterized membrane protein YdbT with pleckstrin-like domain